MSHAILRLFAVGLLTGAFALSATMAGGPGGMIKKGNYNGLWHSDQVKFIIVKVSKNGQFEGVMKFGPKGRFPNVTAAFTGEIDPKGSIVIQRRDDWDQVSRAGAPKRNVKNWIWTGETTGKGLDKGYPFELKIPH